MSEPRLGDVIDDYCIKCRRVTNHSIVSIMNGAAAKVRCRTCYHDHDYRHEEIPPSKKDLKKAELLAASLASASTSSAPPEESLALDVFDMEAELAPDPDHLADEIAEPEAQPEAPLEAEPEPEIKAPRKARSAPAKAVKKTVKKKARK